MYTYIVDYIGLSPALVRVLSALGNTLDVPHNMRTLKGAGAGVRGGPTVWPPPQSADETNLRDEGDPLLLAIVDDLELNQVPSAVAREFHVHAQFVGARVRGTGGRYSIPAPAGRLSANSLGRLYGDISRPPPSRSWKYKSRTPATPLDNQRHPHSSINPRLSLRSPLPQNRHH